MSVVQSRQNSRDNHTLKKLPKRRRGSLPCANRRSNWIARHNCLIAATGGVEMYPTESRSGNHDVAVTPRCT